MQENDSSMRKIILQIVALSLLTGCGINSNFMLRTDKDYEFDEPPLDLQNEYRISIDDVIQFRLFANDGFQIIDMTSGTSENGEGSRTNMQIFNPRNNMNYRVDRDSTVKLPILGRISLAGFTPREAEDTLEALYSQHYIDPFVQVSISNKRVMVFPGNGGVAQVIQLTNNNTTLMEALALAGGITTRGRAKRIKVIRRNEAEREVYLIDLSTIDGLSQAEMIVQANDYIYVEPVPRISEGILREIAPIVSIISSAAVVISVINSVQ